MQKQVARRQEAHFMDILQHWIKMEHPFIILEEEMSYTIQQKKYTIIRLYQWALFWYFIQKQQHGKLKMWVVLLYLKVELLILLPFVRLIYKYTN
jgi:hypothetical protein